MKSTAIADVAGHVFMTVEAKLSLALFVEHLVARGTLALQVGVSRDDFSGHHKRLNILSSCVV